MNTWTLYAHKDVPTAGGKTSMLCVCNVVASSIEDAILKSNFCHVATLDASTFEHTLTNGITLNAWIATKEAVELLEDGPFYHG